jgi:hypothetical protein
MTWLYRFWILLSLPDNIGETEQESKAGSIGEIVLMTVRRIVCNSKKGISVIPSLSTTLRTASSFIAYDVSAEPWGTILAEKSTRYASTLLVSRLR